MARRFRDRNVACIVHASPAKTSIDRPFERFSDALLFKYVDLSDRLFYHLGKCEFNPVVILVAVICHAFVPLCLVEWHRVA